MSHFSKIKTNISDLDNLIKTIKQLGFDYKVLNNSLSSSNSNQGKSILVYHLDQVNSESPLFNFSWNGSEYLMIADVQLWSLNVDFNYFIDRLFQQYAYNIIVNTSNACGFNKIREQSSCDGSIKLTLQKWVSE